MAQGSSRFGWCDERYQQALSALQGRTNQPEQEAAWQVELHFHRLWLARLVREGMALESGAEKRTFVQRLVAEHGECFANELVGILKDKTIAVAVAAWR